MVCRDVWRLGPDVAATNSFETPRAVDVRERRITAKDMRLEHVFPAHSITVLKAATGLDKT